MALLFRMDLGDSGLCSLQHGNYSECQGQSLRQSAMCTAKAQASCTEPQLIRGTSSIE